MFRLTFHNPTEVVHKLTKESAVKSPVTNKWNLTSPTFGRRFSIQKIIIILMLFISLLYSSLPSNPTDDPLTHNHRSFVFLSNTLYNKIVYERVKYVSLCRSQN